MAYDGLRQLGSSVWAPGVFYAIEDYPMTYIVMEYIPGKTAGQCLKEAQEQTAKEIIYKSISLALSELHRIPIAIGSRPAAVSGGKIRHSIFAEQEAPIHYENVQQLEDHINAVSPYPLFRLSRIQPSDETCVVPAINKKKISDLQPRPRAYGFLPVRSIPR
jgi:aminoglycoside phosphotransferase (APT) family kinase protein